MNTPKLIHFGDSARSGLLTGINKLADAVQATLGPRGRPVLVEQPWGEPRATKDGVSVAKAVHLEDPLENMGAQLVRAVASRTNDNVGDGTTTATVLARALLREMTAAAAAGAAPTAVRRGVETAAAAVVLALEASAVPATTSEAISEVCTVSANGDATIGRTIADAMNKVGVDGAVTVEAGTGTQDEVEVVAGCRWERGWLSPYFVTNAVTQEAVMPSPMILLSARKLSAAADVVPALEAAAAAKRPLLIIAEDVDGEALTTLVINKLRGGLLVCAVRPPGFGEARVEYLGDLASVTGATIVDTATGTTPSVACLGNIDRAVVGRDCTLLFGGDETAANTRAETIRSRLADSGVTEWERTRLQQRLAKLGGGVAVIHVGGGSELEVGERKDRYDDALAAALAARATGTLPGGGAALAQASAALASVRADARCHDEEIGIDIVSRVLRTPTATIVANGGGDGAAIAEKVANSQPGWGWDASEWEYCDLRERGILDPMGVVRSALQAAVSVAVTASLAECVICNEKSKVD